MSSNAIVSLELPELPPRFSDRVLELEAALKAECTLENIKKLMELYTVRTRQAGIEHYESVSDLTFLKYQEKLQRLLARTDVQQALVAKPTASKPPTGKSQVIATLSKVQSSTLTQKRTVESLLDTQHRTTTASKRTIHEGLKSQKDNLETRLKQRQSSCGRSGKFSPMTSPKALGVRRFCFEGEVSKAEGATKVGLTTYAYESELESIMEEHVHAKLTTLKSINDLYDIQIAEFEAMPSNGEVHADVISQLLQAMHKNKETHVATALSELEAAKAHKIEGMKKRLLV